MGVWQRLVIVTFMITGARIQNCAPIITNNICVFALMYCLRVRKISMDTDLLILAPRLTFFLSLMINVISLIFNFYIC